jgi:hypothetical protein
MALRPARPATSVKRPGAADLRVDLLVPGAELASHPTAVEAVRAALGEA